MRTRHVLIGAAALAAASLLAGVGAPLLAHAEEAQPGTITVSGTASMTTVPDTATISFGAVTQASTASAALSSNSAAAEKMIAALKRAGIDAKDLRTEIVSLAPRTSDAGDQILGYTATNTVSARIRDLGRAGAVIDAAVAAGANTVQGPSLEPGDVQGLYRQALERAVGDARAKAQALASAGGLTLGSISSMTEGQTAIPYASGDAKTAAAPIEPGTQDITASVTVVFRAS
jgi:uncharacterized protein